MCSVSLESYLWNKSHER